MTHSADHEADLRPVLIGGRRAAVDRWWVPAVVVVALCIAVSVAAFVFAAANGAGYVGFMFLPAVVVEAVVLAQITGAWLRLRRIRTPIELGADGMLLRTPYGDVRAPWSAIGAATLERGLLGRSVRFRLAPGFPTGLPGRSARLVDREGLRYAMRVLDVDVATLRSEVERSSGGRVTVR